MQVILIERLKAFPAFHMPSELFNPFEYTVWVWISSSKLMIYSYMLTNR